MNPRWIAGHIRRHGGHFALVDSEVQVHSTKRTPRELLKAVEAHAVDFQAWLALPSARPFLEPLGEPQRVSPARAAFEEHLWIVLGRLATLDWSRERVPGEDDGARDQDDYITEVLERLDQPDGAELLEDAMSRLRAWETEWRRIGEALRGDEPDTRE